MQKFANYVVPFLAFTSLIFGQEFRASLAGRVVDPTGAPVADVAISLRSVATGVISPATSDEDGRYQVLFLNPGEYVLTAEKQGFQRSVQQGLVLQVAERATLDVKLSVGEVSQSLTVEANAGVVEVESADRGLTVDSLRVEATPLQGRNIFALAWTTPGVAVTGSVTRLRPFDIGGSSGISVNGSRPSTNEVLIDGVSNLARASSVAYVPPVDATDEFRVQTTNYDAQYGWTTGGVVNIITKGGSNDWHGSAFEFLQNTKLNANTFNNNRNGVPRQSSHINTFGGSLGGAIRKNKLFVFGSYENIRQVIPDPFVTSVPTALQRTGDFSKTYYARDAAGQPLVQTIYDPFSTTTDASGALVRTAFPGNVIPPNRLNPIAVKVLGIVPLGNTPGNALTELNNLATSGSSRKFTDFFPEYTGRVDYTVSESTRLFVRYSRNALAEARGFKYSTNSAINVADTTGNSPFTRENHSATIQLTRILNPTTVLDFRLGLARFLSQSGASGGADYDIGSLGFSPLFQSQAARYFPRFTWANYEGAGANPVQVDPIAQTNSFQGSLSKSMGRHSLKMGGEFRLQRANSQVPGYVAGNFSFDQKFTGRNPLTIEPGAGNSIASFLLGTPETGYIDVNSQPARQQRLLSFYLHDDYRITQKLKLNLGLRWDYLGPLTDRFNALTRGFDTTSASPLQAPGINLKGGLLFAGVGGNDRGIFVKDLNNFAPRAGFAYQWNEKTVIRGGYGLMYAQTFDDPGGAPGFSQRTGLVSSVAAGVPQDTLTNPFPVGILRPVGNSQGLGTFLGQSFNFANPNRVVPYTHQFSLEVQRELPGRVLLTLGYVGSRIRALSVQKGFNEVSPESLALGSAALTQNVANPLAGRLPGTALNGATVQRQQLLRPFPQFLAINEFNRSEGESRYDGFQFLLAKRLAKGVTANLSYTYSKTIERVSYRNAQDSALEKVVAAWDVPQSLQLNGVYELPFGTGRHFASSATKVVKHLISGWEVSGIARLQSGLPLAFPTNAINAVPTGVSPKYDGQNLDRYFNTCTLLAGGATRGCLANETPVWSIRPALTLQTWSSRITSIRAPGIRNLDFALMKRTAITERLALTFRSEFMNATNTPQFFNGPILDVNSGNFGRISGALDQTNLPRFIQLSLKLQF
jgi:hypothetical protein